MISLFPEIRANNMEEYWFQQDGATFHTANAIMAHLKQQFPNKLISRNGKINWPARSLDLSPLDFFCVVI